MADPTVTADSCYTPSPSTDGLGTRWSAAASKVFETEVKKHYDTLSESVDYDLKTSAAPGEFSNPDNPNWAHGSETYASAKSVFSSESMTDDHLKSMFGCEGGEANTISAVAKKAATEILREHIIAQEVTDFRASGAPAAGSEAADAQLAAETLAVELATTAATGKARQPGSLPYKEQCFLLSHMSSLAKFHRGLQTNSDKDGYAPKPIPTVQDPGACIMLDADSPFGFINKLTQRPADKVFNNMKTSEIASLQPMIRLFRVHTPDETDTQTTGDRMQEFIFDAYYGAGGEDEAGYTDLDRYLGDKNSRGQGVGIKDFTFAFEAENPYALKKSISAKLTIFANSFDELLRKRGGGPDSIDEDYTYAPYKFIDLALKTGGNKPEPADYDLTPNTSGKLDFRLTAIVGWQKPPSNISGNLRDAINDSCITLNLTPTMHTFNFDDAGRVTFTIEYLAYVDDLFDNPYFNIFGKFGASVGDGQDPKLIIGRKLKYTILKEDCKYDEVQDMIDEDYHDFRSDSLKAQQSLMKRMFGRTKNNNGVFHIMIDSADVNRFYYGDQSKTTGISPEPITDDAASEVAEDAWSPYTKDPSLFDKFSGWLSAIWSDDSTSAFDKTSITVAENLANNRTGFRSIPFFYAGDLIDAILSLIETSFKHQKAALKNMKAESENSSKIPDVPGKEGTKIATKKRWNDAIADEEKDLESFEKEFGRFRLILGPIETYVGGSSNVFNLGDIPVSLSYFLGWLDEQIKDREDHVEYSLPSFLSDFFNQMIRDYLNNNTCFDGVLSQRVRLSQNSVVGYGSKSIELSADASSVVDPVTAWMHKQIPTTPDNGKTPPWRAKLTKKYFETHSHPLLRVSGPSDDPRSFGGRDRSDQFNYMIFSAGRVQPKEQLNGDKTEDEEKGVFHYAIGRDRGLTKTIDLQRNSTPSLAALRYEQQGYNGLMQLRETYDATISSFANVKAFPGTYIYIDPKGFAPSTWGHSAEDTKDEEGKITKKFDLTHLGIGGYYMIKRSTHSFGPGRAGSNIDAVWVAETYAEGSTAPSDLSRNDLQSPAKCKIKTKKE